MVDKVWNSLRLLVAGLVGVGYVGGMLWVAAERQPWLPAGAWLEWRLTRLTWPDFVLLGLPAVSLAWLAYIWLTSFLGRGKASTRRGGRADQDHAGLIRPDRGNCGQR
jgi:hypothetical protein